MLRPERVIVAAPRRSASRKWVGDAVALDIAEALVAGGLDIDRGPRHAQTVGDPPRIADLGPAVLGASLTQTKKPFAGRPGPGDRVLAHVREQLLVDALGGAPQRQLAQRRQIAGLEENGASARSACCGT